MAEPRPQTQLAIDRDNYKRPVVLRFHDSLASFRDELALLRAVASDVVAGVVTSFEDTLGEASCIVLERGDATLEDTLSRGSLERNEIRYVC